MKNYFTLFFVLLSYLLVGQDLKIEEIYFDGNKKTDSDFLKSLIKVKQGDILDTLLVEKDIEQLKRMPSVGHAYYSIEFLTATTCRVKYGIQETFTLLPEFNVWSSKGRTWFKVGAHEYNFMGKNIAIGGFYQNSGKNSYGLNFRAPYLFSRKLGMSVNYSHWKSDEPLYFGNVVAQYEYQNQAIEAVGIYEYDFNNKFELGGSFFNEKYTLLDGSGDASSLPKALDINKTLIKFYHQFYKIKQHFHYRNGFSNDLSIQAVYSRKDDGFYIMKNDFKVFKRVQRKGNLAFRLRFGLATNSDSPFSPFVVDNHENVRGVGDRINRGTATLTFNAEYRYSLYEKDWLTVQGIGFTDVSTIREPGTEFRELVEVDKSYHTIGGGFRIILPKIYGAILRVDYGIGINSETDNGLVIGLGQYF